MTTQCITNATTTSMTTPLIISISCVFDLVIDFTEINELLKCSKELYAFRQEYQIIHLGYYYSRKYCHDEEFRAFVLSRVNSQYNQVCLKLYANASLVFSNIGPLRSLNIIYSAEFYRTDSNAKNIRLAGGSRKINIVDRYDHNKHKSFKNASYVDCAHNTVTDLNVFASAYSIDAQFTNAYSLTNPDKRAPDISMLINVRVLILRHTDINNDDINTLFSKPNHIIRLDISHTAVSDTRLLGNVYDLCLDYTEVVDISALTNVEILCLDATKITNESLRALFSKPNQVQELDIDNTQISDVSMLGLFGSLRLVSLNYTKVTDVSTLGNVKNLKIGNTDVHDLRPLINVIELHAHKCVIEHFPEKNSFETIVLIGATLLEDHVKYMNGIKDINLRDSNITSVDALTKVHTVDLSNTKVTNVDSLAAADTLRLAHTRVKDVRALKKVRKLDLSSTLVQRVKSLGNVYDLDLSDTGVVNVSCLSKVHKLNLNRTKVRDVSALGGVYNLDISNTHVVDVSVLGGVNTLNISNTRVKDVSALGGLYKLSMNSTDVSDISALAKVKYIYMSHCPVEDVSALGEQEYLNINRTRVKDTSTLNNVGWHTHERSEDEDDDDE